MVPFSQQVQRRRGCKAALLRTGQKVLKELLQAREDFLRRRIGGKHEEEGHGEVKGPDMAASRNKVEAVQKGAASASKGLGVVEDEKGVTPEHFGCRLKDEASDRKLVDGGRVGDGVALHGGCEVVRKLGCENVVLKEAVPKGSAQGCGNSDAAELVQLRPKDGWEVSPDIAKALANELGGYVGRGCPLGRCLEDAALEDFNESALKRV